MRYVATINTPGYLPMADEPAVFDSAQEAWAYLAEERERDEDNMASPEEYEYTATVASLRYLASDDHVHGHPFEDVPTNANGTGTLYGRTPGYDGDHDLGLAYSVDIYDPETHGDEPTD